MNAKVKILQKAREYLSTSADTRNYLTMPTTSDSGKTNLLCMAVFKASRVLNLIREGEEIQKEIARRISPCVTLDTFIGMFDSSLSGQMTLDKWKTIQNKRHEFIDVLIEHYNSVL